MDYPKFFGRGVEEVAKDLLDRLLVRDTEKGTTSGRIIEVGAYEGGKETKSREGMKYSPGKIFLMPYRGCHLLNIATDKAGYPSCVEIRKVAFHDKIIDGSGAVANFLNIDSHLDGILLGQELKIAGESVPESRIKRVSGDSDNCLGYFLIKK